MLAGAAAASSLKNFGGVHPNLGGLFLTQQAGSPNMTVDVLSGVAYIPGTEGSKQGTYTVLNDATVNKTVAASDPSLPRIDIVVLKVQDSFYSGGTNAWSIAVVTGTPAGSPSVPAAPANSITISQIAVAAGATSITNANITDRRSWSTSVGGMVRCTSTTRPGWVTSAVGLGQEIYETDTGLALIWNGTAWRHSGITGNVNGINNAGASDTTTSATYVNLAGTSSFSFTKFLDSTRLLVTINTSCFVTVAATEVRYAVRINSTDFDVANFFFNPTSTHLQTSGTRIIVAASVPAGAHTVQGRWRRVSGTGTLTRDAGDWLSIAVTEILP